MTPNTLSSWYTDCIEGSGRSGPGCSGWQRKCQSVDAVHGGSSVCGNHGRTRLENYRKHESRLVTICRTKHRHASNVPYVVDSELLFVDLKLRQVIDHVKDK